MGSPPDYRQNIAEMMQAVKCQNANINTPSNEQRQAIMDKYNEKMPAARGVRGGAAELSPLHYLAGDLSVRNPQVIACSSPGKTGPYNYCLYISYNKVYAYHYSKHLPKY